MEDKAVTEQFVVMTYYKEPGKVPHLHAYGATNKEEADEIRAQLERELDMFADEDAVYAVSADTLTWLSQTDEEYA